MDDVTMNGSAAEPGSTPEQVCLSVDTSGPICQVVLSQGTKVLASATLNIGRTHSKSLSPLIEALLNQAEYTIDDVDVYAAVNGPGSFTGLRIGVATIQGLAFAKDKPVIAISSLEAFAQNGRIIPASLTDVDQAPDNVQNPQHWTLPLIDARNRRAYYALFSGEQAEARVWHDHVGGLDAMWERLQREVKPQDYLWLTGSGAEAVVKDTNIHEALVHASKDGLRVGIRPGAIRAEALALASARRIREQALLAPEDLQPAYLAPTQAERLLKEKKKP